MTLQTDEQTLQDLGIFHKRKGEGIFNVFRKMHTRGGELLLEELFRRPLSDEEAINHRSAIFRAFAGLSLRFPYDGSLFDVVTKYLVHAQAQGTTGHQQAALGDKEIEQGVRGVIDLIRITSNFIDRPDVASVHAYQTDRDFLRDLLAHPHFTFIASMDKSSRLSYSAITAYDVLFRITARKLVEQLLRCIYLLDVYLSVAEVARNRHFAFPRALSKGSGRLVIKGVYHPTLVKPIGNDVCMGGGQHLIFLTGANMAGKSTFLRSISTALYLAHMGFPVAASFMEFSVLDGLYTTINLPDNLGIGASHFYMEVLRVKKMAQALRTGKSFFILFDELFRGTNVKDAHEATVEVIKGFARAGSSLFLVSSHIVEAAEDLENHPGVAFYQLPTRMNGNMPSYTYTLERGVTDDRHGMVIIRNEGIIDLLNNGEKI